MNYRSIHDRIIKRARKRWLVGYFERHHVKPRCLGGSDAKRNIVCLTPEEHYIIHQLLVKMHPNNSKLLWAAVNMTGATRFMAGRKNKLYGWLRRRLSVTISRRHTGIKKSVEARLKMRLAKLGKKRQPHTEATKLKMSRSSKGRPKSLKHRKALALAKIGNNNAAGGRSAKSLINIRNGQLHRDRSYSRSDEYRHKQAERMRQVWKRRHAGELPMPQSVERGDSRRGCLPKI